MTIAEVEAITAAYLANDIGEALRLVGLAADRDKAELRQSGLDAARRDELSKSVRFCEVVRERLLV